MINTKERLKKLKVDCIYGKKKHFNAADRKQKYHIWLGISLIVINVVMGATLFITLFEKMGEWGKYAPLILAFVAALLSAFQTFFNYGKKVEEHRRVANDYLAIMKKCERLEGYIDDGLLTDKELAARMEELGDLAESVNKSAESLSTSQKDYLKAAKGIEAGEESYTAEEMKL